jgi:hypothetical protein
MREGHALRLVECLLRLSSELLLVGHLMMSLHLGVHGCKFGVMDWKGLYLGDLRAFLCASIMR